MRKSAGCLAIGFLLTVGGWAQSNQDHKPGPGHEIGSGAGDVGKGTAKGAGALGKGVAKGAGQLVTLHPAGAATSVGKGAGSAGKDVAVGTAKGSGKVVHGIGRAIVHIF
jgi:hypothetical protein